MGGGDRGPNTYMGNWGDFYGPKQKGINQYALAANRQRPTAGAMNNAIFNTWRRFRGQVLYVVPPFLAMYYTIQWANNRNHFLNSKEGRALYADEE